MDRQENLHFYFYSSFISAKYDYYSDPHSSISPNTRLKKKHKNNSKHIHSFLLYKIVINENFLCDYTPYFSYQYVFFRVRRKFPSNTLVAIQVLTRRFFLNSTMINIKTKFHNFAFLCFPSNNIICIKNTIFRHSAIHCSCSYISEIQILNVSPNFYVGCFSNKVKLTHFPQQLLLRFSQCMQSFILFLILQKMLVSLLLYYQMLLNLFLGNYLSRLSKSIEKVNFILLFFPVIVVRTRINKFKQFLVPYGKVFIDSAHYFKSNFLNSLVNFTFIK